MNTESHTIPDPHAATATDATAAASAAGANIAAGATNAAGATDATGAAPTITENTTNAAPTIAKQIRTVSRLLRSEFHAALAGGALNPGAARRLRHQPPEADTAADRAVRQHLTTSRANVEARIAETLTPEELAVLGEALTKITAALGGRERLVAERSQRREAYRAGFRSGFGEARRGGRGHRFGEGGHRGHDAPWGSGAGAGRDYRGERD